MSFVNDIILPAGRSAVELALFMLLPVMVVMLSLMRFLESRGILDWLVARLAPLLKPVGLTGLGVFAALQINLVSFAAPVATLAMMESRGTSDRHLAAVFAMVLAMAQANASFPMIAMGLKIGPVLLFSLLGGLAAAASTYHLFGRGLSMEERLTDDKPHHGGGELGRSLLDIINRAGAEAFRLSIGSIPLLVLSLAAVLALRQAGAVAGLTALVGPLLVSLSIDPAIILPAFTKYLAGGTAMMGVVEEMTRQGRFSIALLNQGAGFLISPLDLPGVAILASAGPRVAGLWRPAVAGALVGVLLRTLGHAVLS